MAVKQKDLGNLIVREGLHTPNDIAEDKLFKNNQETEQNFENLLIDNFKNHS